MEAYTKEETLKFLERQNERRKYNKVGSVFIGGTPPKIYLNAHISQLTRDEEDMRILKEWIDSPGGFLVLLGKSGCGKTKLSICVAKEVMETSRKITHMHNAKLVEKTKGTEYEVGYEEWKEFGEPQISCFFYSTADIYRMIKNCYTKKIDDQQIINQVKNHELLIIDDLGATRNTEWQIENIYDIIAHRVNEDLPTIVTSNFSFSQIEEVFHQRLRSRLENKENLIMEDWVTDFRTN